MKLEEKFYALDIGRRLYDPCETYITQALGRKNSDPGEAAAANAPPRPFGSTAALFSAVAVAYMHGDAVHAAMSSCLPNPCLDRCSPWYNAAVPPGSFAGHGMGGYCGRQSIFRFFTLGVCPARTTDGFGCEFWGAWVMFWFNAVFYLSIFFMFVCVVCMAISIVSFVGWACEKCGTFTSADAAVAAVAATAAEGELELHVPLKNAN